MIALLLTAVMWFPGHHVTLWACNPGKSPLTPAPSNCERVPYELMWSFPRP